MKWKALIDGLINYGGKMTKRAQEGLRSDSVRCRACGGEIVEVNANTRRKACLKCGKEAL